MERDLPVPLAPQIAMFAFKRVFSGSVKTMPRLVIPRISCFVALAGLMSNQFADSFSVMNAAVP